jgi:Peptidase A4 family
VRIERKVGATVAVLGSLLLAVSGTAPAFAHTGHSAGLRFGGLRLAVAAPATSTGFGGWAFGPKAAKSVTAEYKVPALKCGTALSGVGPIAVLTTGTSSAQTFNAAGLIMQCSGGKAATVAAVVVGAKQKAGTVPPVAGDLIQVTITSSTAKTTATVKDLTKGHTFTVTLSGKGAASVQELIIDDSLANSSTGKQLPVANFGAMAFTSAAVSGKAIGTVTPSTAVNMQTKKKVLQIQAGPITGSKKNMFTNTWKHS